MGHVEKWINDGSSRLNYCQKIHRVLLLLLCYFTHRVDNHDICDVSILAGQLAISISSHSHAASFSMSVRFIVVMIFAVVSFLPFHRTQVFLSIHIVCHVHMQMALGNHL